LTTNTVDGLSVFASSTSDVRLWYKQSDLHSTRTHRTSPQLKQVTPVMTSVTVAGVDLPVAEQMKALRSATDVRETRREAVVVVQLSRPKTDFSAVQAFQNASCWDVSNVR